MVRFKNRHILVEFLQPSLLSPSFQSTSALQPPAPDDDGADEDGDILQQIPEIPFMLPLSSLDGTKGSLKLGDEGGSASYRAIRGVVQDVYGDEGWGRISSSFKGKLRTGPVAELTTSNILLAAHDPDDYADSAIALPALVVGYHADHVSERPGGLAESGGCQWDYQEAAECRDCLSSEYHGEGVGGCPGWKG